MGHLCADGTCRPRQTRGLQTCVISSSRESFIWPAIVTQSQKDVNLVPLPSGNPTLSFTSDEKKWERERRMVWIIYGC